MNASTPVISVLALQNEDVLRWLAANGRPESKAALARALGRDKSNLSKSLDAMVREGLLDEDLEFMTPGVHALGALDRAAGQGGDLAAPHAAFKPHPLNPRKDFESAEAKAYLEELSADLVARGQDHNIVCNPAGDDGLLVIRSGETRWRAIGLAVERGAWPADKPIRYVVKDEGDVDRLFGALGENIHRRALNPIEEAKAFEYARDVLGMENAEIAKRVGKDIRVVQLRLQLLKAPPMVQLDLIAGRTTVTEALKTVQQARAKEEPKSWEPTALQTLLLVELAHFVGGSVGELRSAECPGSATFPDPWPSDVGAYASHEPDHATGRWSSIIHVGSLMDERLERLGLHPLTDPTALFRARQAAGLSLVAIRDLEDADRYHTGWLNPRTSFGRSPVEQARETRTLADQVRDANAEVEALDEVEEAQTHEWFSQAVKDAALAAARAEQERERPGSRFVLTNPKVSGTTTVEGEEWPRVATEIIQNPWTGYPTVSIQLTESSLGRWGVSLCTGQGGPSMAYSGSPPYVNILDPIFRSRADALKAAAPAIVKRLEEWGKKRKLVAWLDTLLAGGGKADAAVAAAHADTDELFEDAPEVAPPAEPPPAPQPPHRDPRAHALRLMQGLAPDVANFLEIAETEDAFDWAKADMPTLADRLVFYLKNWSIEGVAGMAAAMWDRGGDVFSARALATAWNRALVTAFAIADDEVDRFKTMFSLSATGEIVDADFGGLLATLEEGVSNEDGAAMAAAPELRKALMGLMAVRPQIEPDEDPEAANAWAYAAKALAASEPRE